MQTFIDTFARQHHCIIGYCPPCPLPDRSAPFLSQNKEKRTNPEALLPGVRSILVLGLPCRPPIYTNLSVLGTNPDYHPVIKNLLQKLADEFIKPHRYKILVDSPTLDERALAVRAGLGFCGRNGLVISSALGSYFNIGCLLTDMEIPPTPVLSKEGCPDDCRRCIDACPVKLDKSRCLSYLTQKDTLTEEEETLMGGQLYGCDICQTVCPFNKADPPTEIFPPGPWLQADDDSLAKNYSHTAMWWRGPKIMRRNASMASRPFAP